jgi:hypothetical protein
MRLGLAVTTGHPQAPMLEHDPEKWTPVFRKDHAQIKEIERDDDSKKRHHALALLWQIIHAVAFRRFVFCSTGIAAVVVER